MPTFELTTPEGRTFDIDAADIASAHKAIAHAFGPQQAAAPAAPSAGPMASSAPARPPMDALAHMAAGTGFGTAVAAQPPTASPAPPPEPAPLDGAAQNRVYGLARVIASGRGAMPSIQGAVARLPQAERDALSRVLTSWGGGGGATPSPIGERT
jgi:hypothetical protein